MTFLFLKRVLFAFLLAIFAFVTASAQPVWREIQSTDSTANYDTIYRHDTAYYHAMGMDTGDDDDEYAEFQRWATFWESRVGPYGANNSSFYPAYQQMQKLIQGGGSVHCSGTGTHEKNWYYIGNEAITTGSPWCGRVARICVDLVHDTSGNTVYASTGYSGLWRTKNARADTPTWVCLTDTLKLPTMGVYDVAVDPDSANVIYAAVAYQFTTVDAPGGYGLGLIKLRITDGSNGPSVTWSKTGLTNDPYADIWASKPTSTVAVMPDSGNIVIAYKDFAIWRSTDRGQTFSQVATIAHGPSSNNPNRSIHTIRFHPTNPEIVFAEGGDIGTDEGGAPLLRSADGGRTWQEIKLTYDATHSNLGLPNTNVDGIYLATSKYFPEKVAVSCSQRDGGEQDLYICWSSDTGRTWTRRYMGKSTDIVQGTTCIVISPNDSSTVYVGGEQMWKSTNKGQSFSDISEMFNGPAYGTAHTDTRDLAIKKGPNGKDIVYSGNDGTLSISEQSGANWINKGGKGLHLQQPYGFDISENSRLITMGCHDLGFLSKSPNASNAWYSPQDLGDGGRMAVDRLTNYIYAENNGSGYVSTTQGVGFTGGLGLISNLNTPLIVARHRVYYGKLNTLTYRPTGTTGSFSNIHTFPKEISALVVAPSDSNVMYVCLKSGVDASENGGDDSSFTNRIFRCSNIYAATPTWTDITAGLEGYRWRAATSITVSETDPNKLWVCFGGYSGDIQQVYYSSDGGSHWTKMTKGLDPDYHNFPANVILHQEGTDDAVYLGTDIGVFFNPHASDTSSSWECFNKNLPIAVVTDLKIDYCNKTIKASLFGRGLWEAPLAVVSDKPRHITSSQSWHQTEIMHDDLIIDNGVTLTLYGTLRMTKGKKIIVKPGARLIVETTGKITDNCGDSWDGIYVEGHNDEEQTYANQGSLLLKSGSIIENANFAVNVYGLYSDYSDIDYSTTGGIVNATGAIFRNNRKDVAFVSYHYKPAGSGYQSRNKSSFTNCHFYTDNNCHFSTTDMQQHVTMFEVSGVIFKSCHFEDLRTGISRSTQGRDGIYALRSGFSVDGTCNSYYSSTNHCSDYADRTRFDSLRYAVKAIGLDNSIYSVRILGAQFTNNRYGTYLKDVNNARIEDNDYKTPVGYPDLLNTDSRYPYGLYLDNCTDYTVGKNAFSGNVSRVAGDMDIKDAAGLVVRNSGPNTNQFTLNTFDSFSVASESIGNNKSNSKPNVGLLFRCNDYTQDESDLYISRSYAGSNKPGMSEVQGTKSKPAGNLFANNSTILDTNVYDKGDFITYTYNDTFTEPRFKPKRVTSNFSLVNSHLNASADLDSLCSGDLKSILAGGDVSTAFSSSGSAMRVIRNQWTSYIDGGNTSSLITEIQGVTPLNVNTVYSDLMSHAPWLSETVLDAIAQSEYTFDYTMIENLFTSNPQGARSELIMADLRNRTDALPGSVLDAIEASASGYTVRDSLAGEWMYYTADHDLAVNELVDRYIEDTTTDNINSIASLLKSAQSPHYFYTLARIYFDRDDWTDAQGVLSDLLDSFSLSDEEAQYYQDFSNFYDMLNQWKQDGKNLSALDGTSLSALSPYLSRTDDIGAEAQTIAELNGTYTSEDPVLIPANSEGSSMPAVLGMKDKQAEQMKVSRKLLVYPNPATRSMVAEYDVQDCGGAMLALDITDVSGRSVMHVALNGCSGRKTIDLNGMKPGAYLVKLYAGGSVIATQKEFIADRP